MTVSHKARLGRGLASEPGVERSRGDLAPMLGEHAADRSDPEPSTMLGDERTDQRCRGSLSRTKKVVAALRISMVCSNSAILRFELPVLPGSWPWSPRHAARHRPRLDGPTYAASPRSSPIRDGTARMPPTRCRTPRDGPRPDGPLWPSCSGSYLLGMMPYLPTKEGVHQTRGDSGCSVALVSAAWWPMNSTPALIAGRWRRIR